MADPSLYRAPIPAHSPDIARPVWSVMIPAFNCAHYLTQTLSSVLSQAPGPELMQIEVVDDHSTMDDPERVVADVGRGRVLFYRQPQNVGITKNFETCLLRARGQLVHLLHGDDYVLDGFYAKMHRAFQDDPTIGAAFCRHFFLTENDRTLSELEQPESGVLGNWLEQLASEQRIMTPSMVVRRDVYEAMGGFDTRLKCSEDWEMWVRIAARYPIWYETEPLAVYRMHSNSNTGRHIHTADDMRYTREAINIFQTYLPRTSAARISRRAREAYAVSALRMAQVLLADRAPVGAGAQIREALRMSHSPRIMALLIWTVLKGLAQRRKVQA